MATGQTSLQSRKSALRTRPSAIAFAVSAALSWNAAAHTPPPANTLPKGGVVTSGATTARIHARQGNYLLIEQFKSRASTQFKSFSVGSAGHVEFDQPGSRSMMFVRDTSLSGSQIWGKLTANGQVFLSNANGVYFGKGAEVNVGSIVATTHDVALKRNRVSLSNPGKGKVVNDGEINVITVGGYAALIGAQVENSGLIAAQAGKVVLAAADRVALDIVGDGLISVSVERAALNASAVNSGRIESDGGSVLLTARSANALLDTVVNNTGILRANSLIERNGEIVLDGGGAGSVVSSGTLQAAGLDSGTTGGSVRVLGDNVRLASGSRIDASGDAGGGTVLVGGDFQGRNPGIRNASYTAVEQDASIAADAIAVGNGGKVIVWSDKTTTFDGHISARGGAFSGNGGFVEVSGKQNLDIGGLVGHFDLGARNGEAGQLLLDPNRIEIIAGTTGFVGPDHTESAAGTTQIGADDITGLLDAGTNVTLTTTDTTSQDDDIDVQTTVTWAGTGNLHLDAGDEVLGTGLVNPTGTGAFTFSNGDVDLIFTVDAGQNKIYNGAGADPAITALQSGAMSNGSDVISGSVGRAAGDDVGLYAYNTGTLSVDSSGGSNRAYEIHLVTSDSFQITPAPITSVDGIAANNKIYDTNTSATLNTGGASFNGIIGGDVLTVATATGTFADKNAAIGKTVNITGITLGGADAANYTLVDDTATTTADITPASLTVSGLTANNKTYDTTDAATLSGAPALSGVLGGDVVTLSGAANSGTFDAGKNAGTGLAVTANLGGLSLGDTDAGNYQIAGVTTPLTANITPATITSVDGITANSKVYDTNTTATLDTGAASFNGILGSDDLTVGAATGNFTDKNAGNGKTVNITAITLGGADAGNYTLADDTAMATANITPATITSVSGVTANDKVYDTSTTATLNTGAASFNGILGSDVLTLATATGNFIDKNAGNGKIVNITGITLGGADAGNYTLADSTATATANITPATIASVGGITANNKVYDTNTTATLDTGAASFNGILGSDDLTVGAATGNFTDKNAGNGKTVSITAITLGGADAGNYTLADDTAVATANITPATIASVGGITANNKVYDTSTTATLNTGAASFNGILGADALTVASATGSFTDKNAGNGKTVHITGILLAGADAGNYTLADDTASATANITPLAVVLNAPSVTKVYDGSTSYTATSGNLATIGGPLLGGDTVTGATIVYADKNVGTNKNVNFNAVAIDDGNGGNNYNVTLNGNATSTITRLSSVTWTGAGDGNWSDAANWGGAIPDLANVANVNLGGANVTFTSSVGTVNVENVSGGKLIFSSGTMNVAGNATLSGFTQAAGTMGVGGDLAITAASAVTQTGGALNVGGSSSIDAGANAITLTGGNNFVGAVTLNNTSGATQVNDLNAVSIGSSSLGGSLTVTSGGLISLASVSTNGLQQYDNNVRLSGAYGTSGGAFTVTGTTQVASNSTITTGAGNVTLAGVVNGPGALSINSSGATTFGSTIGQTTALAAITTDAAGTTNLGGNVRTTGAIAFRDPTFGAVTVQSTGNAQVTFVAGNASSPGTIRTAGNVILGGATIGSVGNPLDFAVTPTGIQLMQAATMFFVAPAIPDTLVFPNGSSVTGNGALLAANASQLLQQSVTSSAQGSAASATVQEANETFGTDSVAEQVEYGFAGDVGTTPPMDHRLEETGISVPRCLEESREGVACK